MESKKTSPEEATDSVTLTDSGPVDDLTTCSAAPPIPLKLKVDV
ncbi:unnamed protein product [Acanthoscelides obtectus]|uniref:Uncharacterized protein n=1 Tax=Acanthoscelides obtectus TaxID=200917 RepID=A0A9P0KBT4_ACAOB|nr:unnamed protein product [Acanthoscelides obtectus]CAK1632370.1 hypothetical protein AOBTE_LOCUS7511 [Acanthoscelides obtectus]